MNLVQIAILAIIQGLAELLPVSSSAHVIVAEKLMGLDPTQPELTLLLVALHTGTMLAVLFYFWGKWKRNYFQNGAKTKAFLKQAFLATLATGFVGVVFKILIEKIYLRTLPNAEVEMIFGNLKLISVSLAAAGFLILLAAAIANKRSNQPLGPRESLAIGLIQGLCLPFRGFSRSGTTISLGWILGLAREKAEEFSFALAVILTPPVLAREVHRLLKTQAALGLHPSDLMPLFLPSLIGMILSFGAGLLALKWLSSWLEKGKWGYFGGYCLFAAVSIWFFLV